MDLDIIVQGSLAVLVTIGLVTYLSYMIGLIHVLKRLERLNWQAFVPILNFYALVRAIGAPGKWFFFALVPYVGTVYAGSIAIRLGAIFGKGISYSLFWLTFGAFIGMHTIARSADVDFELRDQPMKLLDVHAIRQKLKTKKASSSK